MTSALPVRWVARFCAAEVILACSPLGSVSRVLRRCLPPPDRLMSPETLPGTLEAGQVRAMFDRIAGVYDADEHA